MRPSRYTPRAHPGESGPNLVKTESIRRATLSGTALWASSTAPGEANPTSTRVKMADLQFISGGRPSKVYPRMYTLLALAAILAGLPPRTVAAQATVDPDPRYQEVARALTAV